LFVAFAPAHEPQIAIALIVENGGSGSRTAAPIARQVLDHYLRELIDEKKGDTQFLTAFAASVTSPSTRP
jgi:penicillin-binding protein 2